jgi:hypothetical protein
MDLGVECATERRNVRCEERGRGARGLESAVVRLHTVPAKRKW